MKIRPPALRESLAGPTIIAPMVALSFVVLFKILKVGRAYLSWFEGRTVVTVVLLAVFAGVAAFAAAWFLPPVRSGRLSRFRVAAAVILSLVAGEAVVAFFTGSLELMTLRLIGIFSMDIALFAFVSFSVLLVGRYLPRTGLAISVAISALLLLLYSVEAAFFLRTGTAGNWLLVKFLVMSYDVAGAVKEDIDIYQILWLLVPQIVLVMSVYASANFARRRSARSAWRRQREVPMLRNSLAAGVLFLAAHTLFRTGWLPPSYQAHTGSLAVNLVRDVIMGVPMPKTTEQRDFDLPFYGKAAQIAARPDVPQKNIVFVLLESTRAFSAPPLNAHGRWMPFLDSLAARSVVVERMYTIVPYTTEALMALFGGVVPAFSTMSSYADGVQVGWPGLLAGRGYATAFFTSTFLNDKRDEREMLKRLGFSKVVEARDIGAARSDARTYSGIEDKALLEPAVAWIDSVTSAGQRFVVSCLTQSSHHPYELPTSQPRRNAGVQDRELDAYLNTLAYADDFLRLFFQALQQRNLLESTTFIFVGDHGESFGEHGARFHGMNVWEEGVRVPLIIHDASSDSSAVIRGPYQQIDLFPTVIDRAGFEMDPPVRGAVPISSEGARRRLYLASAGSQAMALVADSIKFVYHYRRRPMQVFNLNSDPLETVDLAGSYDSEVLSDVEVDLLLWQREVNAQR